MSAPFSCDNSKPGPQVMGILNLSVDSFYRGFASPTEAVRQAEKMLKEGADLLDVGAESTRPGSQGITAQEELQLLVPVVRQLCESLAVPVSVDTRKTAVAEQVLDLGVSLINDIGGLREPPMAPLIARYSAGVVIMHMRGTPATMQNDIHYDDCVGEVRDFLEKAVQTAEDAGILPERIIVDPGIGFGKTVENNLELIAGLDRLQSLGKTILLGASRKSFLGEILDLPVEDRLEGSLAVAAIGVLKGAGILRVHDVKETVRVVKAVQALRSVEKE